MREMKDSGSIWIGKIPHQWNLGNFRYYGEFTKGKLPSTTNIEAKGLPIIGASEMLGKECRTFTEEIDVPICEYNDILILWDGANAGIVSSRHTGVVSSTVVKYHCLNPYVDRNYLFYYLKSVEPFFKEKVNGTTIPHMNIKYINEVPVLIPSYDEQQAIASFLDKKCEEIDSLISLQEEMINELQAYKQSVITEAVTKGLNTNAPMKNSGVEWIGEIPEGWKVARLKFITSKIGSGSTPSGGSSVYVKEGIKFIRSQNVYNDRFVLDDVAYITPEIHEQMKGTQVKVGDILFNITGGSIGRCYVVDENFGEANVNQHVSIVRPFSVNGKFLMYFLQSNAGQEQVNVLQTGGNREGLSASAFGEFFIAVPPKSQQVKIASYLDEKTAQIDSLIAIKREKIEELKDYKKSIIYEYVTGKKRVI